MSKLSHSNPAFVGLGVKCERCGTLFDDADELSSAVFDLTERVLCPTHADIAVQAIGNMIGRDMATPTPGEG